MHLRTRLTISVAGVITITSLSIGTFAIYSNGQSKLDRIDSVLTKSYSQISTTLDNPVQVAILLSDQAEFQMSVAYIDSGKSIAFLRENSSSFSQKPSAAEISAGLKNEITIQKNYRARILKLSSNEYLGLSISLNSVNEGRQRQIIQLILFMLVAQVLGISVIYTLFYRDSKLNELVREIQQNNEVMQEFLGDASHELRTPLTVIKGYAEMLNTEHDSTQDARYFARINTEVKRMEDIVKDLLLLAELGELEVRPTSPVNLSKSLSAHVAQLAEIQSGRTIISNITSDLHIQADPDLIDRLFVNIFSNIRKHTPVDSAISITLQKSRKSIQIIIADSGPGLPIEKYSPQAFKRFDKSRSRDAGGTGLGMSIMNKIIEKYDGTLNLSKSGLGGLEIHITFPQ